VRPPCALLLRVSAPLVQELELLQRLQAATAGDTERLRLTISERQLILDGFVESVDQKPQVEQARRALDPQSILVIRPRVAVSEGPRVS
jgi:hypothetical protein